MDWCNNILKNSSSQKHLESRVNLLLQDPLKESKQYAQEKAIKSFCEGIGYLEGFLLFQRQIHPSNIEHSYWNGKEAAYMEALKEVDLIVKEAINRQYRHFCIFL